MVLILIPLAGLLVLLGLLRVYRGLRRLWQSIPRSNRDFFLG